MCRSDRVGNLAERLSAALVGFLVVLLCAPMAVAQQHIPAGQPIPENIRVVGTNAQGVDTRMTVRYLEATGNTTRNNVPVRVGAATIGRLGGALMRRVGPAAAIYQTMKGIVEGVGWAIDELQGQVVNPGTPSEVLTGNQFWCATTGIGGFELGGTYCTATAQAMASFLQGKTIIGNGGNERGKIVTHAYPSGTNVLARTYEGSTLVASVTVGMRTTLITPYQTPGSSPSSPITDYDLGQLLKQNAQLLNQLLVDPDTGAVIRTQEVTDALNDLRRALEAAGRGGPTPQPDLQPDTGWEQGEETPVDAEWPGFCDWATVVCDWLNWTKEQPEVEEPMEVPWEESPFEESTWSSGLGGGSCPSDYTFSVSVAGHSANLAFEYQPICSFATTMRPVVYAMSLLVAGFIIAGLRSSKGV